MNKSKFFQSLEEIVIAPLFIGDGMQYLDEEIAKNTWSMSISKELATGKLLYQKKDEHKWGLMKTSNKILNGLKNGQDGVVLLGLSFWY